MLEKLAPPYWPENEKKTMSNQHLRWQWSSVGRQTFGTKSIWERLWWQDNIMGAKLRVLSKLAMRKSENTSTCFGVKTSQHCRNLPKQSKLRALRALRALAIVNPITWCSHPCHKLLHWTSASTSKSQHIPLWCNLCLVQTSLFRQYFFQIQTFWPTVQFSTTKICRLLSSPLYLSFHSCHFEFPNPSGWNFTFVTGTSKSGKFMMDAFKKDHQDAPRKTWFKHWQTDCRHCPLSYTEVISLPSLVKQNAYPLPWSCLFLNIPNSDHAILPRQSKMSNILGSLRSFKFFKNRIQMGYIKLDRKH